VTSNHSGLRPCPGTLMSRNSSSRHQPIALKISVLALIKPSVGLNGQVLHSLLASRSFAGLQKSLSSNTFSRIPKF